MNGSIYKTEYSSPIGKLSIAANNGVLIGLWIENQKYFESTIHNEKIFKNDNLNIFNQAKNWLDRYFSGKNPKISELLLAPAGSGFRLLIWDILCTIPYGKTTTYGVIAKEAAARLGREHISAQAVGGAVGHNPISIIIPCHRVVGAGGNLTGYAGGLDKKIKLLELEKADIYMPFLPQKYTGSGILISRNIQSHF